MRKICALGLFVLVLFSQRTTVFAKNTTVYGSVPHESIFQEVASFLLSFFNNTGSSFYKQPIQSPPKAIPTGVKPVLAAETGSIGGGITLDQRVGQLETQFAQLNFSNFSAAPSLTIVDTAGGNLIRNSSFELGGGGSFPSLWTAVFDSNGTNTFLSAEGIHSGSYGLKFNGGGTGKFGISQPNTKTVPGRTYALSAYVKVLNAPQTTIRLGFWDEQNNHEGSFKSTSYTGTKDWFRISTMVTTPGLITDATNYYPMIQVLGLTSGAVYLEDVQLTEGSILTPYNSALASTGSNALALSDLGSGLVHVDGSGKITSSTVNVGSGDVSGTLAVGNGGTGVGGTPTNGQLLVGNGSGFALANLTAGSGVSISNSSGGITISANSSASSTFTALTLTNTTNQLTLGTTNTTIISSTAPSTSRTYTIPDFGSNDTFVGLAATQTLTNKTLTAPTIQGTVGAGTGLTLPAYTASGNITGSGSPTISSFGAINGLTLTANATGFSVAGGTTSKTLTLNNTLTFAGTDATTITFQGTDTYVGRATTDTLTNKTLTAPTVQGIVGAGTGLTLPALTASGNITGSGSPTVTSFGSINGLTFSSTAVTPASAGSLSVTSSGANNLILDTGGAATVQIGPTNATAITLGANTTVSAGKNLVLPSGTGQFQQTYSNSAAANAQALAFINTNAGAGVSINGLDITPTNTTTPSSGTNTLNTVQFEAGGALGGSDTTNGINFASATGYSNFIKTPSAVLSSAGALTGLTGLTVASGGETITAGGLTVTAGGETITAGNLGIGAAAAAGSGVLVSGTTLATSATQYGVQSAATYSSASTTTEAGLYSLVTGGAGAFTTTTMAGLYADTNVKGASQTVTNNYGLYVNNQTVTSTTDYGLFVGAVSGGSTNNYGLYVTTPTGTGAVGAYIAGGGLTVNAGGLTVTAGGLTVTAGGLTVSAGNVSFTTTAAGTTTFAGSGTNVFNHLVSTQTTLPTESVTVYTAGTVAAGSTDTKGQFTVTTTAATGTVTLVFTAAYASPPICVVTPASANTQADASKTYVTTATTGLTVNYNVAPTANLQTWNYYCMQ